MSHSPLGGVSGILGNGPSVGVNSNFDQEMKSRRRRHKLKKLLIEEGNNIRSITKRDYLC